MNRRSFLGLLVALVVPKPDLPVVEWAENTTGLYDTLDITRVDVFDRYEFSWKTIEGVIPIPQEFLQEFLYVPHGHLAYEATTTVQRG